MMNLQGKNIILLGGLNGLGLSMAKNLLMKRIANLYIIDYQDDQQMLEELKSESQGTKIMFERMDLLKMDFGKLSSMLNKMNMKMQHTDMFINGMEMLMDRDLQRSMNMNMNLYLNMMLMMRDMMDRNKGGRGGMIINLLSMLGLQNGLNLQQYLINKQMLLSLTEALAQDIRYQQSGVQIMALMPNINQKNMLRNMDWIRGIGLQNLMLDMDRREGDMMRDMEEDRLMRQRGYFGRDDEMFEMLLGSDLFDDREQRRDHRGRMNDDDLQRERLQRMREYELMNDDLRRDQRRRMDRRMSTDDIHFGSGQRMDRRMLNDDMPLERGQRMDRRRLNDDMYFERGQRMDRMMNDDMLREYGQRMDRRMLNEDMFLGQRLGGMDLNGRRIMDMLAQNMIRLIESGQNGMLMLVGLRDSKNLQKEMQLSRL